MGNDVSLIKPNAKDRKKMAKSPISQADLFELKDRLKRVAVKEGGLSLKQWIKTFKEVGIDDEGFARGFYSLFDSQKNEWIDFKEFAIYAALVGRPRREKKIEYCFRVFDRNGSGALDREELQKLIKAAVRVIKRCNNTLPGLTPKKKPSKIERFELTSKEKKDIAKASNKIFKRLDKDDEDEIHYRVFQTEGDVKEVKTVLDYFMAITDALPVEHTRAGPSSRSKKGGKKKGGSKKGKAASSDDNSDDGSSSSGSKKGGSKKGGSKKGGSKKGGSKKGGSKKGGSKKGGSKKGGSKKGGSKKGGSKKGGAKKAGKKGGAKKAGKKGGKKGGKKDGKKGSKKGGKKGSKKGGKKGKAKGKKK